MSPVDPAVERLVVAAHDLAEEAVTSLVESGDPRVARLGRAIRDLRRDSLPRADNTMWDGASVIDPVTHDPAW